MKFIVWTFRASFFCLKNRYIKNIFVIYRKLEYNTMYGK